MIIFLFSNLSFFEFAEFRIGFFQGIDGTQGNPGPDGFEGVLVSSCPSNIVYTATSEIKTM